MQALSKEIGCMLLEFPGKWACLLRCMSLRAQDVTKAQAKERANARNLHNQHTLDRYIGPESPPIGSSCRLTAGKPGI